MANMPLFLALNQVIIIDSTPNTVAFCRIAVMVGQIVTFEECKPDYDDAELAYNNGARVIFQLVSGGAVYVTETIEQIANWLAEPVK